MVSAPVILKNDGVLHGAADPRRARLYFRALSARALLRVVRVPRIRARQAESGIAHPKATADKLEALGHRVMVSAPVILKNDGVLLGAADPRRARFIFGR